MSCFSYTKLGSQCEPNTSYSLTSNTKYISPLNEIYYKSYTPMAYYPGHDSLFSSDADKINKLNNIPKHVKAFQNPTENQKQNQQHFVSHNSTEQKKIGCSSCRS